MKISTCFTGIVAVFFVAFSGVASAESVWKDISIAVQADHPVEVSHKVVDCEGGFSRLEVSLSNSGNSTVTISEIEIIVPISEPLTDDMQVIYGSSCMGRRPLLRRNAGSPNRKSESFMYEMVRLNDRNFIFSGALSWRIFLPVFTLDDDAFIIRSDGEGKQLMPGQQIDYETIVLAYASDWQQLLDTYGEAIAKENNVPARKNMTFSGWATWDYYGRVFSQEDVFGNIDEVNRLMPECNLIQIDGGWWTERGDYTKVRPDLPGGIKAISDRIQAEGKIPGLHFDGFRGDIKSDIYKAHPEYFLHDQNGEVIVRTRETPDTFMQQTFFDFSHPGARDYIAECIRTMREEWGIRYFKVDFMRYGLETDLKIELGVKKVVAHDPSLTGVERFRLGMQTIRDAIGEDNYFLGCSAVFGPCIGFVDGMRTGGDIHPVFSAFPERCLANAGNYYLHSVFDLDPDYLVFRAAEDEDETVSKEKHKHGGDLTLNEARMWADFVALYGNFRLSSDNLMTLRPERRELIPYALSWPTMQEIVPLDLWQHARTDKDGFELLLAKSEEEIYLGVFNWGDDQKEYSLPHFTGTDPLVLKGRHSVILKYEGDKSFQQLGMEMTPEEGVRSGK